MMCNIDALEALLCLSKQLQIVLYLLRIECVFHVYFHHHYYYRQITLSSDPPGHGGPAHSGEGVGAAPLHEHRSQETDSVRMQSSKKGL